MSVSKPVPIIDTLFPGRRVHLIGGASGAGKTTWLMQTIECWRKSEKVHGYASHPVPFVYLSYDRDEDDFHDTCERLSIDPTTYRFISPQGANLDTQLLPYLESLHTKLPDTRLYIIEGIALQTPGGKINDQRVVGMWLRKLQEFCKTHDVTIIGVLHSAKTKERDSYKEPRAKIAGCGAWAGYSSTVVILEEQDAESENSRRTLYILPRNARKHLFVLDFNKEGRLIEITKSKPVKERILDWLHTLAPEQRFTATELCTATRAASASIYAELPQIEKTGLIKKISHGVYTMSSPGENN